jgi:formylglycine-generating enzyme required for sulfatase activity
MMFAFAGAKALAAAAMTGITSLAVAAGFVGTLHFRSMPELPSVTDTVTLTLDSGKTLDVSRYEVTWQDWKKCFEAGACSYLPLRPRNERTAAYPVTGVSRFDVDEFIAWINRNSVRNWRLPTAAEWHEIAEELPQPQYAKLFADPRLAWAADYGKMTAASKRLRPQGSFGKLSNGVHDLAGTVWEWTSTCAPNGAGITSSEHCPALLVEGEHEAIISVFVRDPATGGCAAGVPPANIGFRLVADR